MLGAVASRMTGPRESQSALPSVAFDPAGRHDTRPLGPEADHYGIREHPSAIQKIYDLCVRKQARRPGQ